MGIDENNILDEISDRLKNTIKTVNVEPEDAPVQEEVFEGDDVNTRRPLHDGIGKRWWALFRIGMAIVKDPKTGIRNMSIHRQMILNEVRQVS